MKSPAHHILRAGLLATLLLGAASIARADLVGYWSLDGNADADAGGWGKSSVQSATNGYFPGIIEPNATGVGGLSNALNFAFNLSPLDPSPAPLQQLAIDATTHAFDFAHRRDGVIFNPVISYSTDLTGFTPVSVPETTTTVAAGLEIVVITDGVAPGIDQVSLRVDTTLFPRFFARLGVTVP